MRETFLVGRVTHRSTEMVVVKKMGAQAPFPGPWNLRAVVRRSSSTEPQETPGDRVH